MNKQTITADRRVDALYADMRSRYGGDNSRSNGYLYEDYFRREQRILFDLIDTKASNIVDVGCGSGLMLQPLIDSAKRIVGIDFNDDACRAAHANGLHVIRGDAFNLPLRAGSIDELVTCQFFNQQQPAAVRQFVFESARVIRPGGRVIMVWRNGRAWVHRLALAGITAIDRTRGGTKFPYEDHSFEKIESYGRDCGLDTELQAVSFPPTSWYSTTVYSLRARLFGASNICILRRRS